MFGVPGSLRSVQNSVTSRQENISLSLSHTAGQSRFFFSVQHDSPTLRSEL